MPPLQSKIIALTGGLQDSKPIPSEQDLQTLQNFVSFRGRFALRAPLTETCVLVDDTGAPTGGADVDDVLAIRYHENKMYAVGYSDAQNDVYLYRLESTGAAESGDAEFPKASPIATIWSSVSTAPTVVLASMTGGAAGTPVARLYIADYDEQQDSKYWDGSAIQAVTEDLNDDTTKENLRFHLVAEYQHHLWGMGFWIGGSSRRPEVARFSQPGLIPADEPNVVNNITREWWFVDFLPIGERGRKIKAVGYAGGAMILFQQGACYAIFGYDANSWTAQLLSKDVGAVGPWAVASTGDQGECYFWADTGPHVTDGRQVVNIGEDIRARVQLVNAPTKVVVANSPDDNLVYFIVPLGGTVPNYTYVYDRQNRRWSEASYLANSGVVLNTTAAIAVPSYVLPGPVAAPSNLVATAVADDEIDLSWTNGDTAQDTVTTIHRSASASFTPNDGNKIDEVTSGVAGYVNSGLSSKATWYYRLLHKRNGQNSASSNEDSDRTWLTEPTDVVCTPIVNGIRTSYTNSEAAADIEVWRKPTGGSYTLLDTVTTPGAGAKTYDDTTATCGNAYYYKLRAAQSGETTSVYSTESGNIACAVLPNITSATKFIEVTGECPTGDNVYIQWAGSNFGAGDIAKIYRNVAAAGWQFRGQTALTALNFSDQWAAKSGATSTSVQYRVEAWDDGTTLVDTQDTSSSNYNVTLGVCSES